MPYHSQCEAQINTLFYSVLCWISLSSSFLVAASEHQRCKSGLDGIGSNNAMCVSKIIPITAIWQNDDENVSYAP
jgi:hypothetical protein